MQHRKNKVFPNIWYNCPGNDPKCPRNITCWEKGPLLKKKVHFLPWVMFIMNKETLGHAVCLFQGNYWSSNVNEVQGFVMDQEGKVVHRLFGKWHEGLYCGVPPSAKCVWRPGKPWLSHHILALIRALFMRPPKYIRLTTRGHTRHTLQGHMVNLKDIFNFCLLVSNQVSPRRSLALNSPWWDLVRHDNKTDKRKVKTNVLFLFYVSFHNVRHF